MAGSISGMVLSRRKQEFYSKKDEKDVVYFEATIHNAGKLYVFRSRDKEDLEKLIPGDVIEEFPCRFDSTVNIIGTIIRPEKDTEDGYY